MAESSARPANLIRLTDAIKRYSLSRSTFDRAVKKGAITKHTVGRAAFVDTHQIDAWIMGENQSV
jgi:predicted DNA-binding transcriptional regulator AlpA